MTGRSNLITVYYNVPHRYNSFVDLFSKELQEYSRIVTKPSKDWTKEEREFYSEHCDDDYFFEEVAEKLEIDKNDIISIQFFDDY